MQAAVTPCRAANEKQPPDLHTWPPRHQPLARCRLLLQLFETPTLLQHSIAFMTLRPSPPRLESTTLAPKGFRST